MTVQCDSKEIQAKSDDVIIPLESQSSYVSINHTFLLSEECNTNWSATVRLSNNKKLNESKIVYFSKYSIVGCPL